MGQRAALKSLLLTGLAGAGVSWLVSRTRWKRKRFLVSCYHSISTSDEDQWDPELYITAARLRSRFERLRALRATVLSLDEALARQHEGSLPGRAVVLTFDDGTADFHDLVVPLLEEYNFPATVFVATRGVGSTARAYPGYASYLVWRARTSGINGLAQSSSKARLSEADAREMEVAFRQRWDHASTEAREVAMSDLARTLGVDEGPILARRAFQFMTPEDIASLPHALVSVQLHTHDHHQPKDRDAYFASIRRNQELLFEYSGRRPEHFCYPSGIVTDQFVAWLAELGVRTASTCDPGLVAPDTDRLRLPRLVDTMLTPERTFDAWIRGELGLLKQWITSGIAARDHGNLA